MSVISRSIGGMLTGGGSVILKTVLNLLVIPVLISHLGLDAFGLYLLLISLLELATLLDLGMTNALVTLLGGESADSTERPKHLAAGHFIFASLGILFLITGFILAPQFGLRFNVQPELLGVAETGILLMAPEAALMIYSCYARSILLAHCAHQWTNMADTVYALVSSLGGLLALVTGHGLVGVMVARLAGAVLRMAMMAYNVWRLEPAALTAGFCFSKESFTAIFQDGVFKRLFHLGGHAMMLNVSIILSHKIDDVVIARYLPLAAIGIYEIVFRLLGLTIQIGLKLSEGSFPLFARMAVEKRSDDARQLFLRLSSFLYAVSALLILAILCHYNILIDFFSGHKIVPIKTMPVLYVAIPCILSGVLQMPANAFLFTWGYRKFLTVSSLAAAGANVVLSLVLVQYFGLVGVALGTLIPQLIQHQLGLILKSCRVLDVPIRAYIKSIHGAIILPLGVSYLWISLFGNWVQTQAQLGQFPVIPMGLASAGGLVLGLTTWFFLTASNKERDLFNQYVVRPVTEKFPVFPLTR